MENCFSLCGLSTNIGGNSTALANTACSRLRPTIVDRTPHPLDNSAGIYTHRTYMRPLHAPSAPCGSKAASILSSLTTERPALCTQNSNRPQRQPRSASGVGLVRRLMISAALLLFIPGGSAATADIFSISANKSAVAPAQASNCISIQHTDYDPPVRLPGMTDKEFNETYHGIPNTLKIGILLPFTSDPRYAYRDHVARVSFSVSECELYFALHIYYGVY